MLFISRLNGFVCKIVYLARAQARNRAGYGAGDWRRGFEGNWNCRGGPQFIVWTFRNVNDLIDFGTLSTDVAVTLCLSVWVWVWEWGSTTEVFIERKCSLTLYNLLVLEAIRTDKCLPIDFDWLGRLRPGYVCDTGPGFCFCELRGTGQVDSTSIRRCSCVCPTVESMSTGWTDVGLQH